jgi:hypothetical protein
MCLPARSSRLWLAAGSDCRPLAGEKVMYCTYFTVCAVGESAHKEQKLCGVVYDIVPLVVYQKHTIEQQSEKPVDGVELAYVDYKYYKQSLKMIVT